MHGDTVVVLGLADLLDLALALGLGLLVGVQRWWVQRKEARGTRFAGVRTFGLFGLAGGIAGAASAHWAVLSGVLVAATALLIVAGYWRSGATSGTASEAGLLTLACGFMAGTGARAPAAAAAGALVTILALRTPLHRLVRSLDEREVMAIGRFALISLVVLPLLPNTPFGPLDAWRPRTLWMVVVLVSGFSFLGYLASKWLGASRGTLATAAAGSLVSSTAVTAAMAGRLRAGDPDTNLLNAAVALASAVMFVRVMALTALLAPFALPTLAMGAVPGMGLSLVAALLLWRHGSGEVAAAAPGSVPLRNPFDIAPALLMMALVMALTLAARWVLARFGDHGLAVVLAITGSVDVDSAIITMGNLPPGALSARIAGLVLLPPILLNTLLKAGIVLSGGARRGWPAAAALIASAAAALLPLFV